MYGKVRQNLNVHYGNSGQMDQKAHFGQSINPLYFRTQPFPYQVVPQNYGWHTFQQQGSYYPQGYQPPVNQPGFPSQNVLYPNPNQQYTNKESQFLFQNPLQPHEEMIQQPYTPMNGYPMMNPYPKNNVMPKQPGGMQSFVNSFKSQDGSVDYTKMINTAGQMVNAVTQVGSLIKGFGGIFKA